jgi:hypothetical protein
LGSDFAQIIPIVHKSPVQRISGLIPRICSTLRAAEIALVLENSIELQKSQADLRRAGPDYSYH